jgi:CRISPR-associated Cas5-like protein
MDTIIQQAKKYVFGLEVAGPLAIFADPATGSEPTSFPLPPPTAAEGMIRNLGRILGAVPRIVAIGICSKPQYTSYAFNSHSPIRKNRPNGSPAQIHATALFEPRFSILAVIATEPSLRHSVYKRVNSPHALQNMLFRRLKKEQNFRHVCLGWKEMMSDYVGPIMTPVYTKFSTVIPAIPSQIFNEFGEMDRQTLRNVEVNEGVAHFIPEIPVTTDDKGILAFADKELQSQLNEMPTR